MVRLRNDENKSNIEQAGCRLAFGIIDCETPVSSKVHAVECDMRAARGLLVLGVQSLMFVGSLWAGDEPPRMKFNEVKEIAPGVFFRYSSISATDKTVVFGGSNN